MPAPRIPPSPDALAVPRALQHSSLQFAARELARQDADLAAVLARVGDLELWARRPGFSTLVRIILEQQVSLQAARTMYEKMRARLGEVTPATVHGQGAAGLRALGLTRQKSAYCHGLATRLLEGSLDLSAVARARDNDGRALLLAVPGLGPWSVDIYYLMALRRPDVWPRGDLALAVALKEVKGLRSVPSHERQERLARRWAPWRSVAARILWSHYLARRRA